MQTPADTYFTLMVFMLIELPKHQIHLYVNTSHNSWWCYQLPHVQHLYSIACLRTLVYDISVCVKLLLYYNWWYALTLMVTYHLHKKLPTLTG